MSNQFAMLELERIEAENAQLKSDLQAANEERDALRFELESKQRPLSEQVLALTIERDDAVEQMQKWYRANQPLCDVIKERDALKAELAEVKGHKCDSCGYAFMTPQGSEGWMKVIKRELSPVIGERDALRSACEMLVEALVKIADEMDADTHIPKRKIALEALDAYNALKRQLAGEK